MDLQRRKQPLKVPPFDQYTGLMRAAGLLIAGAIIGCAVFTGIYHHQMNSLLIQNKQLMAENDKLNQDNNTFKKSKNQQSVINRIEVIIESGELNPLDKVTEQELERRLRNDLSVIKGLKIASFSESPHIYQRLLAQKTYHDILDKDYTVNVKTMLLLQTELKVWVTAKEWKRGVS
jgi:cell division protein FtsL